jgi:hypothetical protein
MPTLGAFLQGYETARKGNADADQKTLANFLKMQQMAQTRSLAEQDLALKKQGLNQPKSFAPPEVMVLTERLKGLPTDDPMRPYIEQRLKALGPKPEKAASPEPLHPIIGPDGKPVLATRSDAVGKTPYNASIAGAGEFSPETLRMTAEQYLTGDRQAVMGFARNATARIKLQNAIVEVAKERGMSGADIAAQMADFSGIMSGSRTVGQRAAQISLASSEAEKMIDIVLNTSAKFDRTSFVPFNKALRAFETQTGKPEVKAFGAAINSLVNVYARAISPSGVPTVSDKEHARMVVESIDSPEQVSAVMDIMKQEMKAAQEAPRDVRAETRAAITGLKNKSKITTIKTDAEFDALPSGAEFIGPDGKKRKKP